MAMIEMRGALALQSAAEVRANNRRVRESRKRAYDLPLRELLATMITSVHAELEATVDPIPSPPLRRPVRLIFLQPPIEAAAEPAEVTIIPIPIAAIQSATVVYFSTDDRPFTAIDLLAKRRTHDVVWPRHIAIYVCKMLTTRSLPEIGRRFGRMDHSSILHAARKVANKLTDPDSTAAADVAGVISILRERGFPVDEILRPEVGVAQRS